jgi:uncharacterized protein (DUF1015 family)
MLRISPFVGLRFERSRVGSLDRVTTPPYDVISPEEQARFRSASPYNVIRLVLGEDLPGDDAETNKYRRAASDLRTWREEGSLVPTPGPAYYPYEMTFTLHGRRLRTRGLICTVDLEDWGGAILPHERTMVAPVEDRLQLMRAVNANLSCIQAVFRGPCEPLADLLEATCADPPAGEVSDEAGVAHRCWMTAPIPDIGAWLEDESLMIADGHHRYTMSLRYRDEMRAAHGPGPWDRVMMLIVDGTIEEPAVLPYHRTLVRGEPRPAGVRVLDLHETLDALDDRKLTYGLVAREEGVVVHRVAELTGEPPTVCALHEQVVRDVDEDLRFTHDAVEAEEAVRRGDAVAAYLLPQTNASRIRDVIDRGERLPQKSTFFWPKPRSGMVLRALDLDL